MIEPDRWDSSERWLQQLEKRLNELGSMVKGNQDFQAGRVIDLLRLIGDLEEKLKRFKETQQKIRKFLIENCVNCPSKQKEES